MRLSTLLLIAGLLGILFGLAFLLAPAATLAPYGASTDAAGILMTRFFGAALLQLGLVLYLVRNVAEPAAQRAIVTGSFLGSAAGLLVALMGQLSGLINSLGWTTVLIYGLLMIGYASFMFARPRTA